MPKGIPNKKYTGELKQKLVELVRNGGLSQREGKCQHNTVLVDILCSFGSASISRKARKGCM